MIERAVGTVIFAAAVLALRAALGQSSPGERGDPYSPAGPQPQVQRQYPPPTAPLGPPPVNPVAPPVQPLARYPLPQPAPPQPPPATGTPSPAPDQGGSPAAGEIFKPTEIVATVGNQFIFYGEVSPMVAQFLAPAEAQATTDYDRQELEKIRQKLTRQVVGQIVDTKLMYLEFERQIEKNAGRDKLPDVLKNVQSKMRTDFEEELAETRQTIATARPSQIQELMQRDHVMPRLALLMKENNAETLNELDAILRRYGSSLDKEMRFYTENKLGRSVVGRHVNFKPEVTHQEMLDYYQARAADFAVPAKARFELLTVKFANFATKEQAWNLLAQMGNEVYFGAPFAAIARKHSQEPNAAKGGLYDWTTQGGLASKPIDAAVFSLEPGKLSQIIEDDRGYHIVRVIERQDAGQVAFLDAQATIKKAIVAQKIQADTKKALESLRTKSQVRTIYDEPPELARQPDGTIQR